MADDGESIGARRYQTRARAKATENHIHPPTLVGLPVRGRKHDPVKTKAATSTTAIGSAAVSNLSAPPVRTTRRTAAAAAAAASKVAEISTNKPAKRPSSIPVPTTRRTRSGRVAMTGKAQVEDQQAQHPPKAAPAGGKKGGAGKKKVTFQDDKENLLPAAQESERHQRQETSGSPALTPPLGQNEDADRERQPQQPLNPLSIQPTRLASPIKPQSRNHSTHRTNDLSKVPHLTQLCAPPKRPTHPAPTPGSDDSSADELSCSLTPGLLASPARRPNNLRNAASTRKSSNLSTSVLASPPKRLTHPHHTLKPHASHSPIPSGLQSPPKRSAKHTFGSFTSSSGSSNNNVLASPPKRARSNIPRPESASPDELASQTYLLASPSRIPALTFSNLPRPGVADKPQIPQPDSAFRDLGRDAEGDVEMSDATATEDDADEPPSPTPAPRIVRPGSSSFGLFLDDSEPENPPSKIPQRGVKARGVAPLVSGLEGLGLESSSRRVLFPTATVHALEAAPEISPHQHQGGEVQIDGEIPIDPMLLDAPEEEEEDIDGEYETEDNYVDVTTTIPTAPAAEYTNLYTIQKSILHTTPILAGAVVFIDVLPLPRSHHLSETLSALGAKTVEKWDWEARGGKVGITHVVFEEGSLGTLRKVTESQGLVVCVAGGWVEECSRRRMWIDEALFAVEWDGCMDVHQTTSSLPLYYSSSDTGTEFLTYIPQHHPLQQLYPSLPPSFPNDFDIPDAGEFCNEFPEFATPQREFGYTGRPTNPLGFYTSGCLPDHENPVVLERLMAARRKSLQWAPKVGSPLRRSVVARG